MQLISAITLTEGMPMIWLNVGVLFVQDMITMALEDAAKHRADAATNSQKVELLRSDGSKWEHAVWSDVHVGDVVKIHDRGSFPADVLLLRGFPDAGQCWVNTKPIDGESDTKLRLAPRVTAELLTSDDAAEVRSVLSNGHFLSEAPNDKVNDFSGQLCLSGKDPTLVQRQNVCLRGCQLRSTDWMLGLVVFTGTDTKANYGADLNAKPKAANTIRMLNRDLLFILCVLMTVCAAGATANHLIASGTFELTFAEKRSSSNNGRTGWWFMDSSELGSTGEEWLRHFGIYFLLEYMYMPTTLFVTMPLIQIFTCMFMAWDLGMYDEEQDEPCQVNTASLSEELGQVSHIFSDKTGTLTSNHMEFRRCLIDGVAYGCGDTAISRSLRQGSAPPPLRMDPRPKWAACKPASA
eukprot:4452139-Prymnesium_polylepis.1